MANTENLYPGMNTGLTPESGESYGDEYVNFLGMGYRTPASSIGQAVDPRTANQLKQVSDKLNTGGSTIEVQMAMPEVAESIPDQHLDEIKRLKDLTGSELTLHGALLEPTGITKQGWDETQRQQIERQMWLSLDRGHKLDPKGNIVVTFHSSNGLPDPETRTIDEKTGKEVIKNFWVVDKRTGRFQDVASEISHLEGTKALSSSELVEENIKKQNKDTWFRALQHVNFNAHAGNSTIKQALSAESADQGLSNVLKKNSLKEIYGKYAKGEGQKIIDDLSPTLGKELENRMSEIVHGDIYLREAYGEFKNLFDQAYDATLDSGSKKDRKILDSFKKEVSRSLKNYESNPAEVDKLGETITRGVSVLKTIETPQIFTPLKDFAIDKSSDTFSNLAYKSYKKHKDSAPIISIENPPAGSGLSRAREIVEVIKESRGKFEKKLMKDGLSEKQAKTQSEKLIGATWDVGHINMIRKFGYDKDDLVEETKKIAPYVKHVHLSDNFGMEHTELPMGMGNVPTKRHMEILDKFNKKVKKIVEVGNWYQHFQTTPFTETLQAFGSPIYGMKMAPYWNQTPVAGGGYFAGLGNINPEIHHSYFGAGFSQLPTELGGQRQASGSRLSGNPLE